MKVLTVPSSGSIAGQTNSRNRFGQYIRSRAIPTNPNTERQSAARAVLAGCSQNWATLSALQRAAWQSWADMHPRTDSLGSTVTMTGAMAFNSVNCLLVMLGVAAVVIPPEDPLPDPPVLTALDLGNDAGDLVTGEATFTPTPVPALTRLVLFTSPPMSGGTSFCNDYRYLITKAPAAASPAVFKTEFVGKYGVPAIGLRVFARAKLVRTDGGASPWSNVLSNVVNDAA